MAMTILANLCFAASDVRQDPIAGFSHRIYNIEINGMYENTRIVTLITFMRKNLRYAIIMMLWSPSLIAAKAVSQLRNRSLSAVQAVDGAQSEAGRDRSLWHNSRKYRGGVWVPFTFGTRIRRFWHTFSNRRPFSYRLKFSDGFERSLGPELMTGLQGHERPFGLRKMAICHATRPPTGRTCHA